MKSSRACRSFTDRPVWNHRSAAHKHVRARPVFGNSKRKPGRYLLL